MTDSFREFVRSEILNEIFESPLPLTFSKDLTDELKAQFKGKIKAVFVYTTEIGNDAFLFAVFLHKNAWEVHFSKIEDIDLTPFTGPGTSRLLATAIDLYMKKFEESRIPIRIYPDKGAEKFYRLYDKVVEYIIKKSKVPTEVESIPQFIAPNGEIVRATVIKHSSHSILESLITQPFDGTE